MKTYKIVIMAAWIIITVVGCFFGIAMAGVSLLYLIFTMDTEYTLFLFRISLGSLIVSLIVYGAFYPLIKYYAKQARVLGKFKS